MKANERLSVCCLLFALLVGMPAGSAHAAANPIKVTVDPRMELLSAVQLLSKYGGRGESQKAASFSFRYKQEMADYFAPYKHHRAVILYDRMFSRFFSYDAPPTLMLYLADPPALKPQWEFRSNVRRIADQRGVGAEGAASMMEFVDALRDFAHDSDFQRFHAAHQHDYRAMIRETESKLGSVDIVGPVEDYYGRTASLRYTIVLVPLFYDCGYGPMLERADGSHELYYICGSFSVKRGSPVFGDATLIREVAWHEFGHSFANPLGEKHWSSLARCSSLHDPISDDMRRQAYSDWKTCVYEHIVRAVEARIIFQVEGRKASEAFMEEQRIRGFAYVKPLCKRLEDYEKNRDKYPTLQSFYPQLVEVFKLLQAQNLGPDFYHVSIGEKVWLQLRLMYRYMPAMLAMILSIIIIPPVISAIWAYRDSRKRGKRGWPAALLVLFGIWPLGLIAWLLLRFKPVDPGLPNPRKSAIHAFISVGCSMAIVILLMLIQRHTQATAPHVPTPGNNTLLYAELLGVVSQFLVFLVYCIPSGLFMLKNKEPLRSVGITKMNLWSSVLIGVLLIPLLFLVGPGGPEGKLGHIDLSHGIALLSCAFIGFGEEFLFRGYLQTRLVAWLGKWRGWVLASIVMAFAHLPYKFLLEGQGLSGAFLQSCGVLPGSLLLGFIMLRTRNIAAGGIFHTFALWVSTLK